MEFYLFLLLTIGGSVSAVVLTVIKRRQQGLAPMASKTGILNHDLTTGRFGSSWSFAIAAGKIAGVGMLITCFAVLSADFFGYRYHPKSEGLREFELNDQRAKLLDGTRDGLKPSGHTLLNAFGGDKSMFDDLNKQLADRAREVAAASAAKGSGVGLRRDEKAFVNSYGEPLVSSKSIVPPASSAAAFVHDDLAVIITFWNDVAHEIDVARKDRTRLSDQDIQWGLSEFSGGKKWVEAGKQDGQVVAWTQDGANASLVENSDGRPAGNTKEVVNLLRISTDEFLSERIKREEQ